jgi:hypothetical protein
MAVLIFPSIGRPEAFGPEALAAMSEAFDTACKQLDDTGQPELVLEIIADQIVVAARTGERDPARLRKAALRGFGEQD